MQVLRSLLTDSTPLPPPPPPSLRLHSRLRGITCVHVRSQSRCETGNMPCQFRDLGQHFTGRSHIVTGTSAAPVHRTVYCHHHRRAWDTPRSLRPHGVTSSTPRAGTYTWACQRHLTADIHHIILPSLHRSPSSCPLRDQILMNHSHIHSPGQFPIR